jgi:hypothetical protein
MIGFEVWAVLGILAISLLALLAAAVWIIRRRTHSPAPCDEREPMGPAEARRPLTLVLLNRGQAVWITMRKTALTSLAAAGQFLKRLLAWRGRLRPQPAGPIGEKWRTLFAAIESAQAAISTMREDLSTTYQTHQAVMDRLVRLVSELVSLSQSLASAEALAGPAVQTLKSHLALLLADAGVECWEPSVGLPAPPECEQRPDPTNDYVPPLSVSAVLTPGFRLRHAGGWIVLVQPVVGVATGTCRGENT